MRSIQNDIGIRGWNFHQDIFHGHVPNRRGGRVEILHLDRAPETFQLTDDVLLRALNPLSSGRMRPDGNLLDDVLVSASAVKSPRRVCGWRGWKRGRL